MYNVYTGSRLLESNLRIITVTENAMGPLSGVSLRQGITALQEGGEKSKAVGSTGKPLEGMVRGRSVSSAVESNFFAIASTRQNAGVTEPALHTLSHRRALHKLTPKVDCSRQLELPSELETIGRQGSFGLSLDLEEQDGNNRGRQEVFRSIKAVYELESAGKLEEAKKKSNELSPYLDEYAEESYVVNKLYQCMAYISYASNNIEEALDYFAEAECRSEGFINFPEKLFVMHLMLRMSVDGKNHVFQAEAFYEEMKKWVGADEADDERIKRVLEIGFGENAPQVEIFRNGIKAVFKCRCGDVEAFNTSFEQSISKLTELKKSQSILGILEHSVPMLIFAKNLSLLRQCRFDEVLGSIERIKKSHRTIMDNYIHFQALKAIGSIDRGIGDYTEGLNDSVLFPDYLKSLYRSERDRRPTPDYGYMCRLM